MSNTNRKAHRRWECCKRLPGDLLGRNCSENGSAWLRSNRSSRCFLYKRLLTCQEQHVFCRDKVGALEIAFFRRGSGFSPVQPSEEGADGKTRFRHIAMGTLPPISDQLVLRQVAEIGRFRLPDARSRRNVGRTWPNSFSIRWADSVALMNSRRARSRRNTRISTAASSHCELCALHKGKTGKHAPGVVRTV
jgi:hypothetical protein